MEHLIDEVLKGIVEFEQSDLNATVGRLHQDEPRDILIAGESDRPGKLAGELQNGNPFRFSIAHGFDEARRILRARLPRAIIIDSLLSYSKAIDFLHDTVETYPEIPCLMLMPKLDPEGMVEAFRAGASDVIAHKASRDKLFESLERIIHRREAAHASYLKNIHVDQIITQGGGTLRHRIESLRKEAANLSGAYRDVVARLCRASHWRDDETGDHIQRIGLFSRELASKLGLPGAEVDVIGEASQLHDIGKIGVPDKILLKPGRLTDVEFEWMKTHTLIGAEILSGSRDPLLQAAEAIALTHHEWHNGHGYPYGLKGEDIHLYGKIVTVVDVYDAMLHKRSYKSPVPLDETIDIMRRRRGIQFDPVVFDAFLEIIEDLVRIESQMRTRLGEETKYQIRFGIHGMTRFLEETTTKK